MPRAGLFVRGTIHHRALSGRRKQFVFMRSKGRDRARRPPLISDQVSNLSALRDLSRYKAADFNEFSCSVFTVSTGRLLFANCSSLKTTENIDTYDCAIEKRGFRSAQLPSDQLVTDADVEPENV